MRNIPTSLLLFMYPTNICFLNVLIIMCNPSPKGLPFTFIFSSLIYLLLITFKKLTFLKYFDIKFDSFKFSAFLFQVKNKIKIRVMKELHI